MQRCSHLLKYTKKLLQSLSLMAVLCSPTAALADPPGDDWTLVFSDDFNGTTLNKNKWSTCYWWADEKKGCTNGGSGDLHWYQPDDVFVNNGILRLRAQKRQMNGYEYTSGMISSHDKFAFQYGYAEMRAKMPKGRGFWTTFWLGSQGKKWPPEIDIAEYLGSEPNNVHMTVHYSTPTSKHQSSPWGYTGADFSADYHTYAVEWNPKEIIWYVDGIERRRRFTATENIPHEAMYVMATFALGKAWINTPPDETTPFPSYHNIDYIKVWRHKDSPATRTLTPIISETEGLKVAAKSNVAHTTFLGNAKADAKLSNHMGTMLDATKVNDFVAYTVNVPEARTFNVRVGVKRYYNRGKLQLSIDGKDYGSPQDLYAPSSDYIELDLGNITFDAAGNKSFKFTVMGKNAQSSGNKLAFDYIKLTPK
jgi:beta-glucanase (GH16 family)